MTPIVVFVHIHYIETWTTLRERIERTIDVPFRLIVTTTGDPSRIERPEAASMVGFEAIRTTNRGRDVLPFLRALGLVGEFEIGLKLHGKRSVHRLDGEAWRDALVSSLLPSREKVGSLVERMRADRRFALVGPERSFCSIARHVGGNASSMKAVARRLDLGLDRLLGRTPFFCAGTMFWFRREALARLVDADLDELFVGEAGQTDGTAAHAFERLFAALTEEDGAVAAPADVLFATAAATPTEAVREAVRETVDIDETFVRLPGRLAAFVVRRAPFVLPVYLALPVPLRRGVKAILKGAAAATGRR